VEVLDLALLITSALAMQDGEAPVVKLLTVPIETIVLDMEFALLQEIAVVLVLSLELIAVKTLLKEEVRKLLQEVAQSDRSSEELLDQSLELP